MADINININQDEDLENKSISNNEDKDIDFRKHDIRKKLKKLKKLKKITNILIYFIVIFILVDILLYWIVLYYESKYKSIQMNSFQEYLVNNIVSTNIIPYFNKYIFKEWQVEELNISPQNINAKNVKMIISQLSSYIENKSIDYFTKYNILQIFVKNLIRTIKTKKNLYNKFKVDLINYAYLPEEIDKLIKDGNLRSILLTMQSIKIFVIANDLLTDDTEFLSFYKTLSSSDLKNPNQNICNKYAILDNYDYNCLEIKQKIHNILNKGEIVVKKFIEYKFANFSKNDYIQYLVIYWWFTKSIKDANIFYKFLNYIYSNFDYKLTPSVSIIFNRFDPQKKSISFILDVNTIKANNININTYHRHVSKLINLINLIRWSYLIIGENIDINSLKVREKKEKISWLKYLNTSLSFDVSIQSSVEREIYDFIYNKR